MNAEFDADPPDVLSEDDDYDQPWWGWLLGTRWARKRKKRRTIIADCRRMLRYALDEGRQIPAALAEAITQVDHFLIAAGRRPLSEISPDVIGADERGASIKVRTGETVLSINEVILQTHNALSNLVAPATAQSLRATDPAIVLFGLPPVAKFATVGAVVCTVAFLTAVSKPLSDVLPKPGDKPRPSPTPTVTANSAPAAISSATVGKTSPTPMALQSSPTPAQ
jgi:hypothetical protein